MLPNRVSSTHLKCYPTRARFWALGGSHGPIMEAHIHENTTSSLPTRDSGSEETHPGRVLPDLRLSSQTRDTTAQWPRPRSGTPAAWRRPPTGVWTGGHQGAGNRLGSVPLLVVGASE